MNVELLGEQVPQFMIVDSENNEVRAQDLMGYSTVLLFVSNPESSKTKLVLHQLEGDLDLFDDFDVVVAGVLPFDSMTGKKYKIDNKITLPIFCDEERKAFQAFNLIDNGNNACIILDEVSTIRWIESPLTIAGFRDRLLHAFYTTCVA